MNQEIANQKPLLTVQVTILTSEHGLADERSQLYAEEDEEERLRELEKERLALQIKFKDQLEVQIHEQRQTLNELIREFVNLTEYMNKLRRRLKQIRTMVREQAASNLEMETAIVNADLRTEHAAKIHKLQLDLKWKHGREIQDAQKLPEEKFCKLCLYLSY